ncbi:ABC transporter substrate-binding protein SapA [Providencia vermicola]|uniref:Peptide ABC transporter substrate-binding protein SapA n=1 Tax=Providencia vermicola TaxID=333965 RepID=A0AAX3RUU4_9GAMM|nr:MULTISPECIES: ABC transporter substrate-binding protein SapA [Providencia]ELR5120181.1 peptide ABC transporter substrate-binding protein SapA [Providencia stuartii]ELX8378729.1 peptide ABC transporter substrate-binding protein SapA [Providencia stuartii]EMD5257936.1 peptide ABC transporter substrate-binding protein SapA [Providencia stuartii]MBG5918105.1 peptide ABC transporter substrate-binding protein SapA [Providencia stuartii]MTB39110.1 peptide ABC transporter substrate-binding protein 
MRLITLWLLYTLSLTAQALSGNMSYKDTMANDVPENIRQNGFIYCVNGIVTTFNPQLASSGLIVDPLAAQIYDRLLDVDPFTYRLIPEVASKWEVLDNGATYRLTLRKDVKFQETPWFTPTRNMNADDVVFSFSRMFEVNHPYHYISGGHYPYFDSLQFANSVQSVRKLNNYTVEFRLNAPDASFLWHLATHYAPILSAEYADHLSRINRQEMIDWRPVGTGPFRFDDYQAGQFVRLLRNNHYWKGQPRMEEIVIDMGAGGTGRISKLLTGECDVLAYPAASQLSVLRDDPRLRISMRSGMNIAYLAFNTSKPPLNQLKVRQAIAYAINNERLMQSIYYGTAETAASILPRASWAYDNQAKVTDYNPELSKKMLQELGLENLTLDLWVPISSQSYNPSPLKMAELIQADLAQVGITMNIRSVEGRFQENQLMDRSHDMTLAGWATDSNDPDSFFRPLLSCAAIASQTNLSHWCSPSFDEILHKALLTEQLAARIDYYHQAQQILSDDLPVLPLAYSLRLQAYRFDMKGLVISAFGNTSFAGVYRDMSEYAQKIKPKQEQQP